MAEPYMQPPEISDFMQNADLGSAPAFYQDTVTLISDKKWPWPEMLAAMKKKGFAPQKVKARNKLYVCWLFFIELCNIIDLNKPRGKF